jgi:hypothetical protein
VILHSALFYESVILTRPRIIGTSATELGGGELLQPHADFQVTYQRCFSKIEDLRMPRFREACSSYVLQTTAFESTLPTALRAKPKPPPAKVAS